MNKNVKFMMALSLMAMAGATAGATEQGDTLVFERVDKVRIETRDTVQRIVINGMKGEPDMRYEQRIAIADTSAVRRQLRMEDFNKVRIPRSDGKPSKWSSSFHLNIGLGTLTGTDDVDVMRGVGFEIGLAVTADWNPFGKKNTWSLGLGYDYRTFKAPKNLYCAKDGGVMHFVQADPTWEDPDARFGVSSLQFPFYYTHTFDARGRWNVALGALFNFNFGRIHRSYDINYEHYDVDAAARGVRLFTVEGFAVVDVPYLPPLYVRYAPMSVFKDDKGPDMHMLTFGICF